MAETCWLAWELGHSPNEDTLRIVEGIQVAWAFEGKSNGCSNETALRLKSV